jgi:hypothetical protein
MPKVFGNQKYAECADSIEQTYQNESISPVLKQGQLFRSFCYPSG